MSTKISIALQIALYCTYFLIALPFVVSAFQKRGRALRVVQCIALVCGLMLVFGLSTQLQFSQDQFWNNLYTPVSDFVLKAPPQFVKADTIWNISNPTPMLLLMWTVACAVLAEVGARFLKRTKAEPKAATEESPLSPWIIQGCAAVIILAGLLTYLNSFQGIFILDDPFAISDNESIKDFEQFGKVLMPPPSGHPQAGRPMLNLSLAINYGMGGMNVWGYHAMNVGIHLLVGLVLFGVLRRTLLLPSIPAHFRRVAAGLSLAVVLVWLVHPLQTESVTYICQRAEAIVALFYLLTLYCAIRGFTARDEESANLATPGDAGRGWFIAAAAACVLGMASKEVMVSAPLMVLLYDRTFFSGTFGGALRKRPTLYPVLAMCWAMLLFLVISVGSRGGTAAMGKEAVTSLEYGRTQFGVILHYLHLAFWPDQLCIDYKWLVVSSAGEIVPPALVVLLMLAATVWGVVRKKPWSLLGALFFMVLAPTSSILPIADLAFEHRMYLPLAGLVGAVVLGLYWCCGLLAMRLGMLSGLARRVVAWGVPSLLVLAAVAGLSHTTMERNKVYRSEIDILTDAVKTAPHNTRAQSNLGYWLWAGGRHVEAEFHCREALKFKKILPEAHVNLGNALIFQGKRDEAIQEYEAALRDDANCSSVHFNLGVVLSQDKRIGEAMAHYEAALKQNPRYMEVHNNMAMLLANMGRFDEAIMHFEWAYILQPGLPAIRNRLDTLLDAKRVIRSGGRIVPNSPVGMQTQ